tara:strand:- start:67 stop:585 length:519 start_codon:yes stop_codon:yes gene_type:complete
MSTLAVNAIQNLSGAHSITGMGKILQVQSVTKSDVYTNSSNPDTWTDITGMSVSITPSSSSNKVLVYAISRVSCNNHASCAIKRDSTLIAVGDADGSRRPTSVGEQYDLGNSYRSMDSPIMYLDSPSSTSSLTYKMCFWAGQTFYFNRTRYDTNSASVARPTSGITLMEIGA